MKKMLINAAQQEEIRVALVDSSQLYDLDIEYISDNKKKSNIYKGIITRIEPSLNAAFIDYGEERHGFLPLKELAQEYIIDEKDKQQNKKDLYSYIKEGQELIVQVVKEERGNKGAALTTFISLAGSYLVIAPYNQNLSGISRRIEGDDRDLIKSILSQLNVPDNIGIIIRTAGLGKSLENLQWDLDILINQWNSILETSKTKKEPFLIYKEGNIVVRSIRDYLRQDVDELIVDNKTLFHSIKQYLEVIRPDFVNRVKLYKGSIPIFSHYQIESQIEKAFQREVELPSGGSIVIDTTEALTAIDVNSARATQNNDIEDTAFQTNIEAAAEIAIQLRIRDIGGLVVIDFIDMADLNNQKKVESVIRKATEDDRARIQLYHISKFGLLEMSRQRIRSSISENNYHNCTRCSGTGIIRDNKSVSLSILRNLWEEAYKPHTRKIEVNTPIVVAVYLLNNKRSVISEIESKSSTQIVIIPNPYLETPEFELVRFSESDLLSPDTSENSLDRSKKENDNYLKIKSKKFKRTLIKDDKTENNLDKSSELEIENLSQESKAIKIKDLNRDKKHSSEKAIPIEKIDKQKTVENSNKDLLSFFTTPVAKTKNETIEDIFERENIELPNLDWLGIDSNKSLNKEALSKVKTIKKSSHKNSNSKLDSSSLKENNDNKAKSIPTLNKKTFKEDIKKEVKEVKEDYSKKDKEFLENILDPALIKLPLLEALDIVKDDPDFINENNKENPKESLDNHKKSRNKNKKVKSKNKKLEQDSKGLAVDNTNENLAKSTSESDINKNQEDGKAGENLEKVDKKDTSNRKVSKSASLMEEKIFNKNKPKKQKDSKLSKKSKADLNKSSIKDDSELVILNSLDNLTKLSEDVKNNKISTVDTNTNTNNANTDTNSKDLSIEPKIDRKVAYKKSLKTKLQKISIKEEKKPQEISILVKEIKVCENTLSVKRSSKKPNIENTKNIKIELDSSKEISQDNSQELKIKPLNTPCDLKVDSTKTGFGTVSNSRYVSSSKQTKTYPDNSIKEALNTQIGESSYKESSKRPSGASFSLIRINSKVQKVSL